MNAAEARELGVLQPRYGAEYPHLLAVLQFGLEANHVEQAGELVVLAQLDDGIGLDHRVAWVGEADRLHRTVPQCLDTTLGHDLDRQASVEIWRVRFPFVE